MVVPGGAGFIGSYVVEQLVALGAEVSVVDDLSRGLWARLEAVESQIECIESDLTADADATRQFFVGADVVMNLAGVAPGLTPEQDCHAYLEEANLRVARAVLKAAMEANVPTLLVVSSSCVYPDDAPIPTPEMVLKGTHPETVNRGYGTAKRRIEVEATAASKAQATTKIAIARPFNVYGARDLGVGKGGHVIPSILERVLSPDPEVVVWGSGAQTRSYIHGRDIARALIRLTAEYAVADPINIGSSAEVSMHQLVETLIRLSGKVKTVRYDRSKPEGAARKAADGSKLLRVLPGFEERVDFETGLMEMIESMRHGAPRGKSA